MHSEGLKPLKVEKFMEAALKNMKPYKGSYIYNAMIRDYLEKTGQTDVGYAKWIQTLLSYLILHYGVKDKRILDFGCGSGELTVYMRRLGYDVHGLDSHERHLKLAKILAEENSLDKNIFILNKKHKLPFDDNSFGIITMFSVVEHLSDEVLDWLLPELNRICSGIVYVLAPNRLKCIDDHTGLPFIPWLPHWLAALYVKINRNKYQNFLSENKRWDVYYRSIKRIESLFRQHGFILDFPADGVIFPSFASSSEIFRIGKNLKLGKKSFFIGIPLPWKIMIKFGYPKQGFYPYFNLAFLPKKGDDLIES